MCLHEMEPYPKYWQMTIEWRRGTKDSSNCAIGREVRIPMKCHLGTGLLLSI